jgi:hypothetical protein
MKIQAIQYETVTILQVQGLTGPLTFVLTPDGHWRRRSPEGDEFPISKHIIPDLKAAMVHYDQDELARFKAEYQSSSRTYQKQAILYALLGLGILSVASLVFRVLGYPEVALGVLVTSLFPVERIASKALVLRRARKLIAQRERQLFPEFYF